MSDEPEIPQWELDYLNSDEYRRHMEEHAEGVRVRKPPRLRCGDCGSDRVIDVNG